MKKKLLILSLIFGFVGVLTKMIYRPFINSSQINDFGLHGYLPNLFAALSLCLFATFWMKKGHIKTMIYVTVGLLIYEIEQNWTDRVFDYFDIIATVVGFVISILIFKYLKK